MARNLAEAEKRRNVKHGLFEHGGLDRVKGWIFQTYETRFFDC
jgi:hypothetical protein